MKSCLKFISFFLDRDKLHLFCYYAHTQSNNRKTFAKSETSDQWPHKMHLGPTGCLADTGFRQIKVNYRQKFINIFMCLLLTHFFFTVPCSYQPKLHQGCICHIIVYLFNVI